jgi:hypothetical protein
MSRVHSLCVPGLCHNSKGRKVQAGSIKWGRCEGVPGGENAFACPQISRRIRGVRLQSEDFRPLGFRSDRSSKVPETRTLKAVAAVARCVG